MLKIRLLKILLILSVALFITLITLSNIFEYPINMDYMIKIMTMEDTLLDKNITRAVHAPLVHYLCYGVIVLWEAWISILLWRGAFRACKVFDSNAHSFNQAKETATIGLLLLLVFFGLVFYAIGGQLFASWQSQSYNSVRAVTPYFIFVGVTLLVWLAPD